MKMSSWADLHDLFTGHPCELVAASAAGHLTTSNPGAVAAAREDADLWRKLLSWELKLCAEPGNLDGGTHILAVLRRL